MKTYQLSKKVLNRLAKELNGEIYRKCYKLHWCPADGYVGQYDFIHIHQMDYLCSEKCSDIKLVLKDGTDMFFTLGQSLKILGKYVSPDFFIDWFVHPLPYMSDHCMDYPSKI